MPQLRKNPIRSRESTAPGVPAVQYHNASALPVVSWLTLKNRINDLTMGNDFPKSDIRR